MQVTIFDSYYEAVKLMPEEERGEFALALMGYAFDGVEPEFDGTASQLAWTLIKPTLDASLKGQRDGRKGGRPRGKKNEETDTENPSENPCQKPLSETPTENPCQKPLGKVRRGKELDKEKEKTGKEKDGEAIPYADIVGHLNAVTGASFRPSGEKTRTLIHARWAEGYRLPDFYAVIDRKAAEWMRDPKMCKFLRPETLFSPKFEGYLAAPETAAPSPVSSFYGGA